MAAKVPYPRQLTANETLDTLSHWKSHIRNYFRRDENLKVFFAREKTWDPSQQNYGFLGDNAAEEADHLEGLLDTISGFMPGPYLTTRITRHTKSMNDVFAVIWQHYDVDPNPSSFIEFAHLKLAKEERYIDLFYRMLYHAEMHLLKKDTVVEGKTLEQDEKMSLSHKNLIVLNWIQSLSPSLLAIVQLEKHKELKAGQQLCDMVSDISKNVDEWLKRHGGKLPSRQVDHLSVPEPQVRNMRSDFGQPYRGNFRGQTRGRPFQPGRGNFGRSKSSQPRYLADPNRFCPGCHYLSKELTLDVNFRHMPAECPRKRSVLRFLTSLEDNLDNEEEPLPEESRAYEDDQEQEHEVEGNKKDVHKGQFLSQARKTDAQVNAVWKAKSPTVNVFLKNTNVLAIIDEGSEISAMSLDLAQRVKIPISRTLEAAQAAGSSNLEVVGQSEEDILIHRHVNNAHIQWNLGQCLIVNNLGCDLLIGEPAKALNDIETHSSQKCISTRDMSNNKVVLSYEDASNSFIFSDHRPSDNATMDKIEPVTVRLCMTNTVYPKDSIYVDIPDELKGCPELLVENACPDFPTGIYHVHQNKIKIVNVGPHVMTLNEDDSLHLSPLVKYDQSQIQGTPCQKSEKNKEHIPSAKCVSDNSSKDPRLQTRRLYEVNKESLKQFEYPMRKCQQETTDFMTQVSIDPDNRLSALEKEQVASLLQCYQNVISDVPGRYNGYYGYVNCALSYSSTPPPSVKPRLPNYSQEKLKILANIMDDMEKWGVLAKPESLGIVPTHVHPCILVPKESGKHRLVTDFRSIQSHILPVPSVMPTVTEAMTALSSADFHVELDFSHHYWQNAIPIQDSEKLAIAHPFEGLCVYTVCPQGLRNSAEWGSEILARMYGDMVKDKKVTRIADQIYVLGNSIPEVLRNFKTVLERAKRANMTFKASKLIVCPKSTIILGWEKEGSEWSPTNHVLSPLAKAEPPTTVKKLRGWLGAYRQIAKTIPNHSVVLQPFETLVGGKNSKDRISWSPQLLQKFVEAKQSIETVRPITIPRPSDKLKIYPDWSQDADAVGGRLVIERTVSGQTVELHGGQFSCRLKGAQARWTPCEKECLAIKLLIHHFQPLIRENNHCTSILTDNIVSVHAWQAIRQGKISSSSRVASFISTLSENNVDIKHYPGTLTKVADYNSRNPIDCSSPKCQTYKFVSQEVNAHESYIRFTEPVNKNILLTSRKTWLDLQKQDPTLSQLSALITSGRSPEKKNRNKSLKLLHNLYKRGSLYIASDGLLQYKQPDVARNAVYEVIVVPEVYLPSIIQSLHLKLNHPSPYQLHKTLSRHYFGLSITKIIYNISSSCDVCVRLKMLPKEAHQSSTTKVDVFGTNFSADVMIEKGQMILLCREKLSQFTTTTFLQDETKESMEEGIITSILSLIPEMGATIQVDPGPSLVALSKDDRSILSSYNISLDIGRIHNKQKNPVAENAIKEFRKEWLRLKPDGSQLSDIDRARITDTINKRIRLNGLAPVEFMLKRNLTDHSSIAVDDTKEGQKQFDRRTKANSQQFVRDSIATSIPQHTRFKPGDLVYLKQDLSKSRAREQYLVTKSFSVQSVQWLTIKKCQSGFRNKQYLVKSSEVF